MPVSLFRAVTLAFGRAASLESVITPEISAVWPKAHVAPKNQEIRTGPRTDNVQRMAFLKCKEGLGLPNLRLSRLPPDSRSKRVPISFHLPSLFGAPLGHEDPVSLNKPELAA